MIPFTKMQGLGNDFVIIDSITTKVLLTSRLIRRIADRHFGVGCDQLLIVELPKEASYGVDFVYRVFNADGSEAEQCGNGVRCLTKFVIEHGLSKKRDLVFATKSCKMLARLEEDGQVAVSMGKPTFELEAIPFVAEKKALRYNLLVSGYGEVEIGAVSVGNPHAVVWINDDIAAAPIETLGALISKSEFFPKGANVSFMQVLDSGHIELRVYERGSGETLACGSGACASVVVGRSWGLLEQSVVVKLVGGNLLVKWDEFSGNILMVGPAKSVFVGEIILLE